MRLYYELRDGSPPQAPLFHVKRAKTNPGRLKSKDRDLALELIGADSDFKHRLVAYAALLARWRGVTNLISESAFTQLWSRHVADSAQLLKFAPASRRWLDLGSGAGFPGVIIALQLTGWSGAMVHMIESDRRKCAFLREVASETSAPLWVHSARAECLDPNGLGPIDAVTARAFAPLPRLLKFASFWIAYGATGVFPCGRSMRAEAESLATLATLNVESFPNRLDLDARILRVRGSNPVAA